MEIWYVGEIFTGNESNYSEMGRGLGQFLGSSFSKIDGSRRSNRVSGKTLN